MPGKILSVRPVFSQILVEHLSVEETNETNLILTKDADSTPQAYVIAIGPALDQSKLGFEVGSRVVIQGSYIPVPKPKNQDRSLGIVELHNIKAVIVEEV